MYSLRVCFKLHCLGRREINELKVKCDNPQKCKWEGTIDTLERHRRSCDYAPVPCPLGCTEDTLVKVTRKNLDHHLKRECQYRPYKCESCGLKGTYAEIALIHEFECDKKIITCPNGECSKVMQRGKLAEHTEKDCQYAPIQCKYESIGCDKKVQRKELKVHEQDDRHHFQKALLAIEYLKEKNDTLNKQEPFIFKMTKFHSRKMNNEIFFSQPFYTNRGGYRLCIKVYPNGKDGGLETHISVYVFILKGKYDHKLPWPFHGCVTCTMLNQLEDRNHLEKNLIELEDAEKYPEYLKVGKTLGFHQFATNEELILNPTNNTQYLLDDTVYFKITAKVLGYRHWLECTAK